MPRRRSRRHTDRNDMTRYYSRSPSLHLTGNWLEPLGFTTGQKIEVITGPGQLIIRLDDKR
ncbi:SymE family type I addiction module toxin [Lonsdalea quercina]|uniref:SymE family type I addiction module toxin n=1 Tax=Lonsdalea quercina TaxID=71657 RepID=UPI003976B99B